MRRLLGLTLGVLLFSLWWYAVISVLVAPWPGTPSYDALHPPATGVSKAGPAAEMNQLDINIPLEINPLNYIYHSSSSSSAPQLQKEMPDHERMPGDRDREPVQTDEKNRWRATYEWTLIE